MVDRTPLFDESEDCDDKNVRHTMYSWYGDNKNMLSNNADNNNDCCL